LEQITASALPR